MNIENAENRKQRILITDRSELTVTGVEDVQSFDDKGIILKSNFGMLAIDGEELRIVNLSKDTGELLVGGKIGGIAFFDMNDTKKKRGFFSW